LRPHCRHGAIIQIGRIDPRAAEFEKMAEIKNLAPLVDNRMAIRHLTPTKRQNVLETPASECQEPVVGAMTQFYLRDSQPVLPNAGHARNFGEQGLASGNGRGCE
jgi:hypothetical protein